MTKKVGGRGGKKLKVFRTPIGFHDAYVAAPSQKAALEAWGSDSNLFAAGSAELVTDPALTKEPLARPGEVVKRLRGSEEEQVAALGTGKKDRPSPGPSRSREGRKDRPSPARERGSKKKRPRPSRAAVEKAEQALAKADAQHREALDKLRAEEAALQKRRRDLERKQREERDALAETVEDARDKYRAAMAEWTD